jgi:dihydroorotase
MKRGDAKAHYESRPEIVEEEAVHRAITLSREADSKLHIAHLSSERGAEEVRKAKLSSRQLHGRGDVTAETCPQYLVLDKEDYESKGSFMKSNPSIKRKEDRIALLRAIRDGTIDMIASDHAPHTLQEKTSYPSVFDQASGFPGLETSVAVMLTCVHKGRLPLSKYVKLTSEGPAKAWGLFPRKGLIALGTDADFTIVDAKKEWKIDPEKFISKAKYSPFEDFKAKGAAVYTVVRGNVVMDHGAINEEPRGEMLRPLA